jgi:hypothetical protein
MNTPILSYQPKRLPEPFLERFYERPKPLRSLEDHRRFFHEDIADLSHRDLETELYRVVLRISLELPPDDDWLFERKARLFAEQERRGRIYIEEARARRQSTSGNPIIVRRNGKEVTA